MACVAPERIKELQNPFPPRLDEIVYQHTDLGLHTTELTVGRKRTIFLNLENESVSHPTVTKQYAVGEDLAFNFHYVV